MLSCSKCSYRTTSQNHLTRHEITHKSLDVLVCSTVGCLYRTDNRRLMQRHLVLKHSKRDGLHRWRKQSTVFSCPLNCGYTTMRPKFMKRHLVSHTGTDGRLIDNYRCNECNYKTKRRQHYLRHISDVHSTDRPFLCDLCGLSFKRKDYLAQHSVVHQNKDQRSYPFQCLNCSQRFRCQVQHLSFVNIFLECLC